MGEPWECGAMGVGELRIPANGRARTYDYREVNWVENVRRVAHAIPHGIGRGKVIASLQPHRRDGNFCKVGSQWDLGGESVKSQLRLGRMLCLVPSS